MSLEDRLREKDPATVARMFTEISPRYDLLNRLLSFGRDRVWRLAAVRMARPSEARRVLDLATGTGDLAFAFAQDPDFEGEVVGLDLSSEMVRRARKKAAARNVSHRVQFREGDALDIPEPDGFFDIASIGFGVRNFADLEKGLLEAHRVLTPGGRLIVLEFFRKREKAPVRFYLDHILPRVGRIISRNPSAYHYLRRTKKGFLSPDEFVSLLHSLGFAPVVVRPLTMGIAHCIVARKGSTPASRSDD